MTTAGSHPHQLLSSDLPTGSLFSLQVLASPVLGRGALLSSHHFSLPDNIELCHGYQTTVLGLLQEQTPGSSLHSSLPALKRKLREKKSCRRLFSEEEENLKSNLHGMFERGPVGLCTKDLSSTCMKEDREATAGGGVQAAPYSGCSPAPHRKESHHPLKAHLQKPRGAQGPKGSWGANLRTHRKGHLAQAPPRDVPGDAHPQGLGVKPIQVSHQWSTFQTEKVTD